MSSGIIVTPYPSARSMAAWMTSAGTSMSVTFLRISPFPAVCSARMTPYQPITCRHVAICSWHRPGHGRAVLSGSVSTGLLLGGGRATPPAAHSTRCVQCCAGQCWRRGASACEGRDECASAGLRWAAQSTLLRGRCPGRLAREWTCPCPHDGSLIPTINISRRASWCPERRRPRRLKRISTKVLRSASNCALSLPVTTMS